MEIHTLKLSVTEEELNSLVMELPSGKSAVENLRVRLTSEGIVILGDYPTMFMKMAFETLWVVRGIGSVVEARLASVRVSGLPAGMLRGVLLKTIRDLTAHEPGVRVEEETILVDLSKHTAVQRLRLRINLIGVSCSPEGLVIEAGPMLV
ncbi:MAG TPA: hypothetical protein VH682_25945 [Gemmataceae bacterium]|jgi:hypothetical protein